MPIVAFPASDAWETRPWRDTTVSTRHAEISIRRTAGMGLPILLLHAGGRGKESFDHQLESALGARHNMIAMDFPGHGASGEALDPSRTYAVDGLADLALEVLEAFDIEQAVVVGAGLGARVGLSLTQTFPGLVGLVLTGTAPWAIADDASATNRMTERAAEFVGRDLTSTLDDHWPGHLRAPVMVIDGVDVRLPGGVDGSAGDAAICVIPNSGPAPYMAAPAVFNHLVLQFMQRMDVRARSLRDFPPTWYGG